MGQFKEGYGLSSNQDLTKPRRAQSVTFDFAKQNLGSEVVGFSCFPLANLSLARSFTASFGLRIKQLPYVEF